MKKLWIKIIFLTLISFPASASELTETCARLFQKSCDKITHTEYEKNCTMDAFTWDNKGKISGLNNRRTSTKKGDILIVTTIDIGCAHAVESNRYYFNKNITLTKLNCGQLVKLWNDIKAEEISYQASEPENTNLQNECGIKDSEFTLSIQKSDLKNYQFFINQITRYN